MDGVQTNIVPWKNKIVDRENIYTGIRPRTTQMLAAVIQYAMHSLQRQGIIPAETADNAAEVCPNNRNEVK